MKTLKKMPDLSELRVGKMKVSKKKKKELEKCEKEFKFKGNNDWLPWHVGLELVRLKSAQNERKKMERQ